MAGGVINTGSNPKLLWPGLKEVFGIAYKEHPLTYPKLFAEVMSDKNYEEYLQYVGTGLGQVKAQGTSVSYDSMQQGWNTRLVNTTYALGYICTEEEIDDNLYPKISKGRTRALAFSMVQAHEQNMHLIYNRAFTSGYVGGDNTILCQHLAPERLGRHLRQHAGDGLRLVRSGSRRCAHRHRRVPGRQGAVHQRDREGAHRVASGLLQRGAHRPLDLPVGNREQRRERDQVRGNAAGRHRPVRVPDRAPRRGSCAPMSAGRATA